MTEQQYKELLETLGIGTGKSSADTKELLEAKLNEYLDRTDAEAEQMASDVQDAMDYLEDLIEKMGGGIALVSEETEEAEESSRDSLAGRTAGRKGAITYTSSSAAGGASTGSGVQGGTTSAGTTSKPSHPWFYSTTGDKNIEDLFKLAEGDLAQGDYQHAESVYDTILRTEMTNAGAYMGKVLAKYQILVPKDIAICYTQGLEIDSDLKRAENCGNDKQKKFIKDVLEERRQAMIYKDAERVLQERNDAAALLNAATEFESLGAYRDAKEKAKECKEESEKVKEEQENQRKEDIYNKAAGVLLNSDDITKLLNAATEFESLGEYRDAKKKADGCREKAKVQEREYWVRKAKEHSLLKLIDTYKEKRNAIIEEVIFRFDKCGNNAQGLQDETDPWLKYGGRSRYHDQDYISDAQMQQIRAIESNIVYGKLTEKEKREYGLLLSYIFDGYRKFFNIYEEYEQKMAGSIYNEENARTCKDKGLGPTKIQGTLREYIKESRNEFVQECEEIRQILKNVPTISEKTDIETQNKDVDKCKQGEEGFLLQYLKDVYTLEKKKYFLSRVIKEIDTKTSSVSIPNKPYKPSLIDCLGIGIWWGLRACGAGFIPLIIWGFICESIWGRPIQGVIIVVLVLIVGAIALCYMSEISEWDGKLKEYEAAHEKRDQYAKNKEDYKSVLSMCQEMLEKLYNMNVILPKCRGLVGVSQLYDYFRFSRCEELEGADGAYSLYENELQAKIIYRELDMIQTLSEKSLKYQKSSLEALQEAERLTLVESNEFGKSDAASALKQSVTKYIDEINARYF